MVARYKLSKLLGLGLGLNFVRLFILLFPSYLDNKRYANFEVWYIVEHDNIFTVCKRKQRMKLYDFLLGNLS